MSAEPTTDAGLGPDPSDLPLFTAAAPARAGRVRGTFSMTPHAHTTANPNTDAGDRVPRARPLPRPYAGDLDWSLVASIRQQASDRLSAALGQDRGRAGSAEQREQGRAIITDLLEAETAERISAGEPAWTTTEQEAMAAAVENALFGLGRLQPLVDDDRVENIIITGYDRVTLELTDGRLIHGPAVADSDQELIDFLVFLASRSEVNARPFSEAQPRLHLRLDGGARLAAAAWVTPRPSVVIRRHRHRSVTLEDLVGLGTLTDVAASFLAAAVKARKSIVVAGAQGAGKTTLVRALCAQIPPHEVIGTFETEYELHLHELPGTHPIVFAWEARPGSGERGQDGRAAGEFTLSEALFDSFRFNLSRQIVGEVRGHEILAMLKAMESGAGSISTTHAPSAEGAIGKLVTCAMEAGPHVTHDYAVRAIAAAIDVVVYVHLDTAPSVDGTWQRHRWVAEIITVTQGEKEKGYAVQHVFRTAPGEREAAPHVLDDDYRDLARYGFDLDAYVRGGRVAS
ncbi:ATPase, T2SS/T4P/T4SS family [Phycicoccus sp.]|uniref:CpaF family protein n=1 Tax=Phycicoccus sp. TaxID=1902410 RepID=UPI002C526A0C|nr:ATPase, T2SS/T4P/T4SS family [Phycicoccus sp.]HMM96119.1 ATPase, T2SS/T4P/T4SS family [Phycicoccus sp.]